MGATVKFGNKIVGDGQPCFITFEIGPTHEGVDSAKRLIKYAADAGADAVKVQIFDPDRLIADRNQLFSYNILKDRTTGETETIEEPLYDILLRRYLTTDQWIDIKKYSDELGMAFFSTVGFNEDIELIEKLGCHSIKIASADVNHFSLLRRAAKSGLCLQLDTGMATLGEVEQAVDIIRSEGNENIVIHQCPSGYPARVDSINLRMIETLKKMFPYPAAFSDHTPGSDMDVAAVAIGANMVEKTITEDRTTRSVEHIMSIEPNDMKRFVKTIKEVELALGTGRRVMSQIETKKRDLVRRSIFLTQPAKLGVRLDECKFEFKRPGLGISPSLFETLSGAKLNRNLPSGSMVRLSDLNLFD